VTAVALDTGELVARRDRLFARHRTLTALEHRRLLHGRRGRRKGSGRRDVEVETRPLERYDALIPA
jgi:hypothetical protein